MPNKTYIIAEIGPNHNGSFSLAKKIIKKLKSSGVNAIKFQLANPDLVYSDDAFLAKYQKLSGTQYYMATSYLFAVIALAKNTLKYTTKNMDYHYYITANNYALALINKCNSIMTM